MYAVLVCVESSLRGFIPFTREKAVEYAANSGVTVNSVSRQVRSDVLLNSVMSRRLTYKTPPFGGGEVRVGASPGHQNMVCRLTV